MTSIPRRFASDRTSSITGSAPWAPVPIISRLPPQGISSPAESGVAELFAELLGRSFLPFPHFAAVDHHIMRVALSLDLNLAKFDQSCFHISLGFLLGRASLHRVISSTYTRFGSTLTISGERNAPRWL